MEKIKIIKKYEDNLDNSLNKTFQQGIEMLLGEFEIDNYKVSRKYIQGQNQIIRLHFTKFEPKEPKATIALVHGLGEYSGRYMHLADYFATNGFIVIMLDMTGYGLSGGARGCSTQDTLHKDVEILLKQARTDLPLFLYGHSMGGGIVLTVGQRNPDLKLAGIIASFFFVALLFLASPFIKLQKSKEITETKIQVLRLILGGLQDFVLHPQLDLSSLSKNDRIRIEYIQDPNNVALANASAMKSLMEHSLYLLPNCQEQKFPLIICHGQKDGIVDFEYSVEYYNKCGRLKRDDKKLKSFDNGYHELHNDEEYIELRKGILEWCNDRVGKAPNFQSQTLKTGFIIENPMIYLLKYILLLICMLIVVRLIFKFAF